MYVVRGADCEGGVIEGDGGWQLDYSHNRFKNDQNHMVTF